MTLDEIRAAVITLEEHNVPPVPCSACKGTYYLIPPAGWDGKQLRFVCDCGEENVLLNGQPCADAETVWGDAVRYQGPGRR